MPDFSLSNWTEVKQSIINEVGFTAKAFLKSANEDIIERLSRKGLSKSELISSDSNDKVTYFPESSNAYEDGKIYFNEVYDEISQPNWVESINVNT